MMAIHVKVRGQLFEEGGAGVRKVAHAIITELTELGEQRLSVMLTPRPQGVYLSVAQARRGKASKGNYLRNVHSVVKELHARIDDSGVLYGPWLEGVGSRNATTRFKGYASFRRVAQWLQSHAQAVAQHHVSRYVERLNR